MKLTKSEWNATTGGWQKDYVADTADDLQADFDPDCNSGSTIYVISTQEIWVKNSQGKWQKAGTTEVLA